MNIPGFTAEASLASGRRQWVAAPPGDTCSSPKTFRNRINRREIYSCVVAQCLSIRPRHASDRAVGWVTRSRD
jgi:hypothetical protein